MVDIPYHTHQFDIPTASEGEIRTGIEAGKAITPDKLFPVLADKANKATTLAGYGITDAATKTQGQKADTAVQPAQVSAVGFSGRYDDLLNKPLLGGSSGLNVGTTTGTVAAGNDTRIVNAAQKSTAVSAGAGLSGGGTLADNFALALSSTSLASLALANSAVQPSDLGALARKDKITTEDIVTTGSTSGGAVLTRGGVWVDPSSGGDMFRLTYDPKNKRADVFDLANMDEAANAKVMTAAERTKLAGIAAGAQVNTVTSVAGKTGAVTVTKADVGLGNVANKSEAEMVQSGAVKDALDNKLGISGGKLSGSLEVTSSVTVAHDTYPTVWFRSVSGQNRGLVYYDTPSKRLYLRVYADDGVSYKQTSINQDGNMTVDGKVAQTGQPTATSDLTPKSFVDAAVAALSSAVDTKLNAINASLDTKLNATAKAVDSGKLNGEIIRSGSIVVTTEVNGAADVLFSSPFPSACRSVVACNGDMIAHYPIVVEVGSTPSATKFRIYASKNGADYGNKSIRINYIAIGV